jgi:membrane-bound metal-dependent hydrolase YbcI (DUF457 family)
VYIEHLVYSAALAVIVGMIFSRYYSRNPSWIIIAVAFVPDIDLAIQAVLQAIRRLTRIFFPVAIHHGDLHNVLFLILFSLLFAWLVHSVGIRFTDGLICSAIGIAAHLFEDALIANPAYVFLWPITIQRFGIGIMKETPNIFGIANSTVLPIGIILLAGVVLVRTLVEGTGWWRVFLQGGRIDTQSL